MVRLCAVHYHDTDRLRKKNKHCLPSVPTASRSGPEHIWLLNSFLFFLIFILKTNNTKPKILRGECYSSFIANSENSFLMLIRYADISRLLYKQYVFARTNQYTSQPSLGYLSPGSSMVRASHRRSKSSGFDSHLGLRNIFLSFR